MADRAPRRHYAFTMTRVKGGSYQVDHVIEFASRGEADKHSLSFLGRYGDAAAITLEHELVNGDVLEPGLLRLQSGPDKAK